MKVEKAAPKTYLVEVALLTKSPGQETLSYFSTERIASGTLVKVPIRKGVVPGVVLSSKSALSAKSEIRQADFALRKIAQRDISKVGLSPEFLEGVKSSALFYATSPGNLLTTLLPNIALEKPEKFFLPLGKKKSKEKNFSETLILQMETEERYGQYRGLVRQSFAKKNSVMFVVPTHYDALKAKKWLSQGIETYVYLFTLKEKFTQAIEMWERALNDPHPVLFITTPAGLAFDREDIDTIIMDRENSRAYRTLVRPFIHYKVILERVVRAAKRQLILGDSVLSLETLMKEKRGEYGELSLVRWRLPAAPSRLVDASGRPDAKGKFEIFSTELKELIAKALESEGLPTGPGRDSATPGRILLFGARKGLAPTTVCGDCGFILPCLNCGAPVVLHKQRSDLRNSKGPTLTQIYICHACGTRRDSTTLCGYCRSWKLVPLGIGIERIAAEARELFHETNIEILDKDYAPSDAKAKSIIKRFNEHGGILVGTELALFHLEKVPYAALVSADSLFSIPDFGINERIFYLVSRLREIAQHETIIQTRNIGKQVLAWATQGNIIEFYLNEIADRKALMYPPYSIFIKVAALSEKPQDIKVVKERFLKWNPEIYKDSMIIRLAKAEWPNHELSLALSLLGPQFSVKVEPESII